MARWWVVRTACAQGLEGRDVLNPMLSQADMKMGTRTKVKLRSEDCGRFKREYLRYERLNLVTYPFLGVFEVIGLCR